MSPNEMQTIEGPEQWKLYKEKTYTYDCCAKE